jgi:GDP-4-dehydro-6-deoxy-D-mannose reductase
MTTLLVTGHNGFVGTALLGWLPGSVWAGRVSVAHPSEHFDLRDPAAVEALLDRTSPDWILHLAAQSHVPTSIDDPVGTLEVNVIGTTRLLQALVRRRFAGRFLYVSSADVYGKVAEAALPLVEEQPLRPGNPYAVSKAAAEMMCRQAHWAHGLDAIVARTLAEIALGRRAAEVPVGNLDVTRDFSHVLDICEGYLALLERGRSGETYNLCSGRESRLRDLLDTMIARSGIAARVVVDPARYRPADQPRVVGDASRARRDAGWQAARPLEPLLDEMIEDWKRKLSA